VLINDRSDGTLLLRNRVNANGAGGITASFSNGSTFIENQSNQNVEGGLSLLDGSSYSTVMRNRACRNSIDAFDDGSGVGNLWRSLLQEPGEPSSTNVFCTSSI